MSLIDDFLNCLRRLFARLKTWLLGPDSPPANAITEVTPSETDVRRLFGAFPHGVNTMGVVAGVGKNTGGDGRRAYVMGFGSATQVLLRSLTARTGDGDPDDFLFEDALIHPIAFCARHFVELFLKDLPREIYALRNQEFKAAGHHSIQDLWKPFADACLADRRLLSYPAKLSDAVMAMGALDPTGQTFRYRNALDGKIHLQDLQVIHVDAFESTFVALRNTVESLYQELEGLQAEYFLGTYTDQLSRQDLVEIAKRIGAAATGGKEALKAQQASIQTDYNLSRSQYAAARKVIERHYLLSELTGKERPLKKLNVVGLSALVAAINKDPAAPPLSRDEVAAAWGLARAGGPIGHCEYYDTDVKDFLAPNNTTTISDVMRELRATPTLLRKGLVKLGQRTLIQALDTLISEEQYLELERRSRIDRGVRRKVTEADQDAG